ncbi:MULTISPECIES: hypothetical protein [unclassified Nonomuraea]|uniref:hypothetical protein n=1 Tax=unclassified Nonomuraea TaxID=2593643 RepID=UPI0035C088C2
MGERICAELLDISDFDLEVLKDMQSPALRSAYRRLAEASDETAVQGWNSAI